VSQLGGSADLRAHYAELYQRFGPSHEAVQWSSRETQLRRFEVLAQVLSPDDSLIDLGCGLGDLLEYLRQQHGFRGRYLGLDFVPGFVAHARARYAGDPAARFEELDVTHAPLPSGYDVVLTSGMFNNRIDDNWGFLVSTLAAMFGAARKAVAFNVMSHYVDYEDPGLYYCDPLRLFDHCKRELTPRVTLRHDYLVKPESIPFELSLYLYR
jgi:SAM-dependent methyltransferase